MQSGDSSNLLSLSESLHVHDKSVSRLMLKDDSDMLKCIAMHPLGIMHVGK